VKLAPDPYALPIAAVNAYGNPLRGPAAMIYRVLVDTLVLVHFAFVLFIVLGGFLVLRWRRIAWVHVPAAIWGVLVEWSGWECPLTPLENWLRVEGHAALSGGGFIDRYVATILYPAGLTRCMQVALGAFALSVNLIIYRRVSRQPA
jgi:hypothetical protein